MQSAVTFSYACCYLIDNMQTKDEAAISLIAGMFNTNIENVKKHIQWLQEKYQDRKVEDVI